MTSQSDNAHTSGDPNYAESFTWWMQKQTMDLCSGFVKAGHDVTVITTSRLDGLESEKADGVEILYLKGCKPG